MPVQMSAYTPVRNGNKGQSIDSTSSSTVVADDDMVPPFGESTKSRYSSIIITSSTIVILLLTVALSISMFISNPSPFYRQIHGSGSAASNVVEAQQQSGVESPAKPPSPAHSQPEHQNPSQWLRNCGNATTGASHARSLGCRFDIMSFSWLPPACYDKTLTDAFWNYTTDPKSSLDDPGSHWQFWLEPEGIHEASLGRVLQGEFQELYVSFEFHLVHCTYMWRKMHRALLQVANSDMMVRDHGQAVNESPPAVLESYLLNMKHTEHCEKMLLAGGMRNVDGRMIGTKIKRKFPDCVWL